MGHINRNGIPYEDLMGNMGHINIRSGTQYVACGGEMWGISTEEVEYNS